MKDALHSMMKEALNPYGGSRRNNNYHKAAALMLINHLVIREIDRRREQGYRAIEDYHKHLLENPRKLRLLDGLKKLQRMSPKI